MNAREQLLRIDRLVRLLESIRASWREPDLARGEVDLENCRSRAALRVVETRGCAWARRDDDTSRDS
jgi:hypothetical protein